VQITEELSAGVDKNSALKLAGAHQFLRDWGDQCHTVLRKTGYEAFQHGEKHQQDSSS